MALDFPSSPTNGQTYTSSGRTWTWNSSASTWESTNTLTSAQITSTLGYTPANQAGDTFTGNVTTTGNLYTTNGRLYLNNSGANYIAATAGGVSSQILVETGAFSVRDYSGTSTRLSINSSGNVTAGVDIRSPLLYVGTSYSGSSYVNITGNNNYGGTNYHGFLTVYNTGASSNGYSYWRMNPTGAIEFVNSAYSSVLFTFAQSGDFTASGNITAYSDSKLKSEIRPISNAVDKVMALNGCTFTRIDKDDSNVRYAGLIAQDVQRVLPEAIQENETISYGNIKSVDYNATIALLVEAIKEQQAHILRLEELIASGE